MSTYEINERSSNLDITCRNENDGHILTNSRMPQAQKIYRLWTETEHQVPFPEKVEGVSDDHLKGIYFYISGKMPFPLLFKDDPDASEVAILRAVLVAFAQSSEEKSRLILDGDAS